MREFTICLCFGRDKCEEITRETAERNNADSYAVIPVEAPFRSDDIAYKGIIILYD